jgi:hypothetical protein
MAKESQVRHPAQAAVQAARAAEARWPVAGPEAVKRPAAMQAPA